LAVEVWISWVVICEFRGSSSPSSSSRYDLISCLVYYPDQTEDFPRYWCFVGFGSEVSMSFLCCLALPHFVRQLFCGYLHQTWCILLDHEKFHQCFWVFWG
jgi:hypothetical protein